MRFADITSLNRSMVQLESIFCPGQTLKHWLIYTLLILGIGLSACQPATDSLPTAEITATSLPATAPLPSKVPAQPTLTLAPATPSVTPLPVTPTITATSAPDDSPTPSPALPTLLPGLAVAQDLPGVVVLENYAGLWSPAFDEMVSLCPYNPRPHDIILATAPSFKPRQLGLGIDFYSTSLLWSLDGNRLFFAGPPSGETSYSLDQGYGGLWSIDRKGKDQHPLGTDWQQYLPNFVGWMNDVWLVAKQYAGGGHWLVSMIDSQTGEVAGRAVIHGPVYPPNRRFIPAANEMAGWYRLYVITSDYQPTPAPKLEGGEFARSIPWETLRSLVSLPDDQHVVGSIFKGWKPRSNQMLVYGFESLDEVQSHTARLLVWDVETDTLQDLLPNGVDGSYSPNGQWLAAISLGSAALDASGKPLLAPPQAVDKSALAWLYIFGTRTGQVKFSLPTAVLPEQMEYGEYPGYIAHLAFAPNSAYLAFLTPAQLELDAQNRPLKLFANDGSSYLNVLDITTGSVVFSSPTNPGLPPVWSPDSSFLAFADADANWVLHDFSTQNARKLTLAGGQNITRVAWSHSGAYLSLIVKSEDQFTYYTVIIAAP